MKTIILYTSICLVLLSCNGGEPTISYSEKTVDNFNKLEPPVILFSKSESIGGYSVQLMDGNNKLHFFGNMSSLANGIGDNYSIGDTLK